VNVSQTSIGNISKNVVAMRKRCFFVKNRTILLIDEDDFAEIEEIF
jgi:hypothetical protein